MFKLFLSLLWLIATFIIALLGFVIIDMGLGWPMEGLLMALLIFGELGITGIVLLGMDVI